MVEAMAGVDQEVGAAALFRIGHLPGEDRREFLFRHARTGENAGALHRFRRGDHDYRVDTALRPALEQQGDVEDGDVLARFGRAPAETVDSVELGAKTNLAGGRLQLDGVVYAYAYNDFQTTRFIDGLLRTVNAGEARAHGSELEARWRLADHARLVATYGYNRARLTTGAMKGNRFRLAPDHKASLRLEISRDVPRATLVFSPSYAWQSTIYFSDDNDLPSLSRGLAPDLTQDERQDPYGVLDLTLSYRHASGWTVTGFVRNVLDQQYIVDAGFIGESYGFSASARGPARTAGVSALIRF